MPLVDEHSSERRRRRRRRSRRRRRRRSRRSRRRNGTRREVDCRDMSSFVQAVQGFNLLVTDPSQHGLFCRLPDPRTPAWRTGRLHPVAGMGVSLRGELTSPEDSADGPGRSHRWTVGSFDRGRTGGGRASQSFGPPKLRRLPFVCESEVSAKPRVEEGKGEGGEELLREKHSASHSRPSLVDQVGHCI